MAGKFERIKQRLSDADQAFIEFIGIEPAFKHNIGCGRRGGLMRVLEHASDEVIISEFRERFQVSRGDRAFDVIPKVLPAKVRITRSCRACGVTDSFLENKGPFIPTRSSW